MSDVWADTDREFDEFFATNYERIVARLATTLRDPELARDSVAEALSRAWEQQRAGQTLENLPGWIHTVAMNCARDTLRRRANGKQATRRLANEPPVPVSDDLIAGLEIDGALAGLAPRQREIARLRFVEDLSYDQIGDRLGIAPGTVKNVLRRVRYVLLATMMIALVFAFAPRSESDPDRIRIENPSDGSSVPSSTTPGSTVDPQPARIGTVENPAASQRRSTPRAGGTARTQSPSGEPVPNASAPSRGSIPAVPVTFPSPPGPPPSGPPVGPPVNPEVNGTSFMQATTTNRELQLSTLTVEYGDIEFTWSDARTSGAPAFLHFSSPAGIPMQLASRAKQVLRLGLGDYQLCAQRCRNFSVVPPALRAPDEAGKVVTVVVGDAGLRTPHREIKTGIPQSTPGVVAKQDTAGRWTARPPRAHTIRLRGDAEGGGPWTVQVASVPYTVMPGQVIEIGVHAPHLYEYIDIVVATQSGTAARLRLV